MGAINSVFGYDEETDSLQNSGDEVIESQNTTPVGPRQRLPLQFDPRSPSERIFRTPIVVDKAEKPQASVGSVTPSSLPSDVCDPRSPTSQFSRTPILPGNVMGASPARASIIQDSFSGIVSFSSESGIDSKDVSPAILKVNICKTADGGVSPDSVISLDCSKDSDDSLSLGDIEAFSHGNHGNHGTPTKEMSSLSLKLKTSDSSNRVPLEDTPKSQCTLRARVPLDRRLGELGGKPTTPRSPLATMENSNNSPRKALGSKKTQGVKSGLSILSSGDKQSMRVGSGLSHNWALDKENQA